MKRLLLPLWATACILGLSAAASAKEELFGLRICGASGCHDVMPWPGTLYGATTRPARPAAYYSITYLARDGRPVSLGWPALCASTSCRRRAALPPTRPDDRATRATSGATTSASAATGSR